MTRNIKLILEYEGTAYRGWQYQDSLPTVQGALETAIFKLSGESVRVTAAGRTDTGVHARGQVVNFPLQKNLPLHKIKLGLNAHLPRDIAVKHAETVSDDFNARFSAKQRIYHYYICTERTALNRRFCWQFFQKLNYSVLPVLADIISGEHDFGAFCRMEAQADHKRCIVYESRWDTGSSILCYRIAANRFLHGMVRTLVGTMIDVARGKTTLTDFRHIMNSHDRTLGGPAAPAKGLVLEEVIY